MSKRRTQQILLAALVLVFVILVGRRLGSLLPGGAFSAGGGLSSVARRSGPPVEQWRETLPEVEELDLSALERGANDFSEGRDPFQIRRAEPPTEPRPDVSDIRRRIEEARQRQSEPVPAPVQPPKPTPPAVDVVFLGSFGNGRMRLAVFTDGDEIFNVPEGEVLKDKFIVVKIGVESADLGFVGFPDAPAKRLEIGG